MKRIITKIKSSLDPNLYRLFSYLPKYRLLIVLSVFFMILAATSSSLIAVLIGQLTDIGFYEKQAWIILIAPIGLIIIAGLNGGSMFMSNYILSKVSQSLLKELRHELFSRIIRWPSKAYQNTPAGLVASKFINEANVGLSQATKSAIILIRDSLQLVFLIAVLVWHNITLTLVTLIIAPAIVFLLKTISKKSKI